MRFLDKMGGRKLLFLLVALTVGTVVDIKAQGGLSSNLKDLIIALGAMYVCGNVAAKSAEVVKVVKESKKSTRDQDAMQELIRKMQTVEAGQQEVYANLSTNTLATGEILKRISGQSGEG